MGATHAFGGASKSLASLRDIGIGNWLYYGAFALCAFTTMLMRTTFYTLGPVPKEDFEGVAYFACAVLLVAKLLLCPDKSGRFFLALAIAAVGAASFWVALAWRFSLLFFFVAAGEGVSLRRLAGIALVVQVAFLAVTIPCSLAGRIENIYVHRLVDGVWVPRSSFGYSHPNMLGQSFLTIVCAFAVLRFPRAHPADLFVYIPALLAAAFLVSSRTAAVCIFLAVALALLAPAIVRRRAWCKRMACIALATFCFLGALSLFMMVAYDPNVAWMATLDSLLSTRFSLAHEFFEVYKPTLFGRDLMFVKTEEVLQAAPDNAYVRTLIKQGIVPALVLGSLCVAALLRAVRMGTYDACVFGLLVYALVAVMEMYATNFTLNFFLIGCAWVLFGQWLGSGQNQVVKHGIGVEEQ